MQYILLTSNITNNTEKKKIDTVSYDSSQVKIQTLENNSFENSDSQVAIDQLSTTRLDQSRALGITIVLVLAQLKVWYNEIFQSIK